MSNILSTLTFLTPCENSRFKVHRAKKACGDYIMERQQMTLTPDQVIREYQKALADFMGAQQAMLCVDLYCGSPNPSIVGMANYHHVTMRFEAAKAIRAEWAHAVASLDALPPEPNH
jgi:hypothetical protein